MSALSMIERPMAARQIATPPRLAGPLYRVFTRFLDHYPDMTIFQAMHFLYIAENPGISQHDLIVGMGVTDTTGSRTVQLLGPDGTRGKPGLNLIVVKTDPQDRRQRLLSLSDKGRRLLADIGEDLK